MTHFPFFFPFYFCQSHTPTMSDPNVLSQGDVSPGQPPPPSPRLPAGSSRQIVCLALFHSHFLPASGFTSLSVPEILPDLLLSRPSPPSSPDPAPPAPHQQERSRCSRPSQAPVCWCGHNCHVSVSPQRPEEACDAPGGDGGAGGRATCPSSQHRAQGGPGSGWL